MDKITKEILELEKRNMERMKLIMGENLKKAKISEDGVEKEEILGHDKGKEGVNEREAETGRKTQKRNRAKTIKKTCKKVKGECLEGERENDNEMVGVGEPKTQTQRESDAMGIKPSPIVRLLGRAAERAKGRDVMLVHVFIRDCHT